MEIKENVEYVKAGIKAVDEVRHELRLPMLGGEFATPKATGGQPAGLTPETGPKKPPGNQGDVGEMLA